MVSGFHEIIRAHLLRASKPAVIVGKTDKKALGKLTAKIGDTIWAAPEKRLVRATTYKKGKEGADPDSKKSRSDERIGLRYATAKEAGTLAAPQWLPRGSMVKIFTEQGVYAYIAADDGTDVESRKAAKELGKTKEQQAAPVLDFCAPEQLWPDFIIVEIYYYAGKVAFNQLTGEEQEALFYLCNEICEQTEVKLPGLSGVQAFMALQPVVTCPN